MGPVGLHWRVFSLSLLWYASSQPAGAACAHEQACPALLPCLITPPQHAPLQKKALEVLDICQYLPQGCVGCLKAAIASGAFHPSVQRNDGTTALHLAVQSGHSELVSVLLHAGARLDVPNIKGQTPVHIAVASKNASVLAVLLEYCSRNGKLQQGSIRIDAVDAMGRSALHSAAAVGHLPSVQHLLDAGASTTVKDHAGVLRMPCRFCTHANCIKHLRELPHNTVLTEL
jgi:ankyrin repeat protein